MTYGKVFMKKDEAHAITVAITKEKKNCESNFTWSSDRKTSKLKQIQKQDPQLKETKREF